MRRRFQGFTLIEILMVLAVVGVLAALGINSFIRELQKRSFQESVNSLLYQVEEARAASVKNSTDQTVVFAVSGNKVTLTHNGQTVQAENLTMCVPSGNSCANTAQVTFRAPHGEMCWGNPCSNVDSRINFTRGIHSATLILQGVFGHASIRDLQ